jgi:hypothetical protein
VAAREEQPEHVVAQFLRSGNRFIGAAEQVKRRALLLGPSSLPPEEINGSPTGCDDQPRPGFTGHAVVAPKVERTDHGVLDRVFCELE